MVFLSCINMKHFQRYLDYSKTSAVGLCLPRRWDSVVGVVRVVGAGAKEVEDSDDVEGKNRGWHAAAVQKRGETTVEEDTGGGGEKLMKKDSSIKEFSSKLVIETAQTLASIGCDI